MAQTFERVRSVLIVAHIGQNNSVMVLQPLLLSCLGFGIASLALGIVPFSSNISNSENAGFAIRKEKRKLKDTIPLDIFSACSPRIVKVLKEKYTPEELISVSKACLFSRVLV